MEPVSQGKQSASDACAERRESILEPGVDAPSESDRVPENLDAQLMLFAEATSALLSSAHTPDVLRTIIELARRFGSADAYAVWRKRNPDGMWTPVSSSGLSEDFMQHGVAQNAGAPSLSEPMIFEDVFDEPYLAHRHEALRGEGICSMLVTPLNVHGDANGAVTLYWKTPHRFSDSEVRIATALGNMAAAALGTAELHDRETELRSEAEASERRSAFLAEAGVVFASSLDYETTLRSIARLAIARFADWCAVDLAHDGLLERVTLEHIDPAKIQLAREFRKKYPLREDDLSMVALRTGEAILIESVPEGTLEKRISDPEQLQMAREMGIESVMVTPMINRGRILGLLTFVSSKRDQLYTKADLALARELANRAAMAIDNAQLYANVRASEARYRSLVSATTSVVWTVNPSGQFSEGQPSWQAYTGQSWEEHRWFGWFAAVHPHDRRRIGREWLRSVRNERTFEVEGRLWHAPTGGYRYCWARAIPVRDTEGAISEWIGTVTDMHERKQAEEERKTLLAREQQARSAAQLLNRVGQALSAELDPQSLARSVIDLATKLVNAEIGALFHRVVNEDGESQLLYTLSGASSEESENVPMPGDAALFGPIFRGEAVVRSADISNDSSYGSSVPFHGMPGGHLRVRSYLAVPVISGSGEVLGGLVFGHSQPGVFGDQAEEFAVGIAAQAAIALDNARLFKQSQEAQIALRRSNDELRRANEDLNQFAYSASHDLQEPLRMVSTFSQLLQRRYGDKLDEQARQYIGYSVQGAQHMEALLRDLLAYTHAANLKGEEAVSVDANAALQKALSSLQGPIERTSAEISFDPLPVLNIAEIHLVQLFQNLIGNALKYAGDRSPHIEIAASAGRGEWLFSIRDNGIGIDPRYKDQIFGLFKRLHSNSKYPGTGIGLAICQKIVERYGGKIRVESKLGAGATFYFTIPR